MLSQDPILLSTAVTSPKEKLTPAGNSPSGCDSSSALKWAIVLLPLAYLWFRLIDNLRLEWRTNPQYAFGWVVPMLCFGLVLRKWQFLPNASAGQNSKCRRVLFGFILLAFLYLPTRLIEAATPEWRPIQWVLGIETAGLTLCAIYLARGRHWLWQLAFPVCFFFVAIPWPTPIEVPIIQTLTSLSAGLVVELLGWVDVPAMVHGNVIEVATGMVGIDEACSGIRSFQSSLMISLFFGEFYGLSRSRRWLLIPLGFALSMAFNICRMSLLTFIAAKKGVAAISQYHDPAGITITILCTLTLWGLALLLRRQKGESENEKAETLKAERDPLDTSPCIPLPVRGEEQDRGQKPAPATANSKLSSLNLQLSTNTLSHLSLALMVWLVVVETGVGLWYHFRELNQKPGLTWTVKFPVDNPTFKELPLTTEAHELLRFDQGKNGQWREPDGTLWQSFYFNWQPGQVAGYLAKRHTPEICLTAAGLKMIAGPRLEIMNVQGVELPMRCYTFDSSGGTLQVFQCRWEAGAGNKSYLAEDLTRFSLIRGVWAGRGNQGQKVLEVIISGMDDPVQARAALVHQLQKLIKVEQGTKEEIGKAENRNLKN